MPKHSTLMKSLEEIHGAMRSLTVEESFLLADICKEVGAELFVDQEWDAASKAYLKPVEVLHYMHKLNELAHSEFKAYKERTATFFSYLASTSLKAGEPDKALKAVKVCVKTEKLLVVSHMRKSQALAALDRAKQLFG